METKRELQIIIAGTYASGKSTIAHIIHKALKEAGLVKINFDLTDEIRDYGSKEKYEEIIVKNLDSNIEHINENTNFTIKQKQLLRNLKLKK